MGLKRVLLFFLFSMLIYNSISVSSDIIIDNANTIWTTGLEGSSELYNSIEGIDTRIIIDNAEVIYSKFFQEPIGLTDLLISRIIVDNANSIFKTDLQTPDFAAPEQTLNVPKPLSPGVKTQPGEYIGTTTPTFKWEAVADADSYVLYISKYPYGEENLVFDSGVDYGDITSTSFELPDGILSEGYRYRWNMRAKSGTDWSDFSERLYFTTAEAESSLDLTPTGFYYPTGIKPTRIPPESYGYDGAVTYYQYAGWLARSDKGHYSKGENDDGTYYDRFHIGQDIEGNENDPVYAISDGEIVYVSTGGWGNDENGKINYGILVKHKVDINGVKKDFIAVYGHVKPTIYLGKLEVSSSSKIVPPIEVKPGQQFAELDRIFYDTEGAVHLHFGIRQEYMLPPPDPYGIMRIEGNWDDINFEPENTNEFVDPINWIETKKPYSLSSNIDNINGGSDTPGFELIFVILAFLLALFWKRKRKLRDFKYRWK